MAERERERETDRQTETDNKERHTDKPVSWEKWVVLIDKRAKRQSCRTIDMVVAIGWQRERERERNRQTDRDRQQRQTDRQTSKQEKVGSVD